MEDVTSPARPLTKYIKYASVMILLLGASGFLPLAGSGDPALFYYLTAALAGILGIIHVLLLYGLLQLYSPASLQKACLLTAVTVVASAAIAGTGYAVLGVDLHFLAYLSAFIIPFLLSAGYSHYLQIPADIHKYWYHPLQQPFHTPPPLDQAETELVKFVLNKNADSAIQTSFTLDAPVDLPVSQIFINLINEHNKSKQDQPIDYVDKEREPVGWLFFIRQGLLFKKQFIDPDLTLRRNRIAPGKIIYASRNQGQLQPSGKLETVL